MALSRALRRLIGTPALARVRASAASVLARLKLRAWARLHTGQRLRVDLDSSVGRSILLRGTYEPPVEEVLRRHLRPGDTFVDVGANVGYLSVVAATLVGPTGKVHAFEPNRELVTLLQESMRENGLTQLHPNEVGLWSEAGELQLRLEPSSAHSYLRLGGAAAGAVEVRVPVTTLDDYLDGQGQPPVRLVKVDVEGAELHVLRGARRCLARDRPVLVVELLDWGLERYGDDIEGVFAFLGCLGYTARDLGGQPVSDATDARIRLAPAWTKNLVFETTLS